ncbi:MAG: GTPase HflX [Pseudanabaena sp. ELA607]
MYRSRLPQDAITTPEFAQRLANLSHALQEPLCVMVNRRGQVVRVGLGSPNQTKMSPLELPRYGSERLSGLRCLTTNLRREAPNANDLTAMALQRLDTLVTLTLNQTGYVDRVFTAYLVPESAMPDATEKLGVAGWTVSEPQTLEALCQEDFLAIVAGLEAEFRREFVAEAIDLQQDRVILVGLITDNQPPERIPFKLIELQQLVESAGGAVVDLLWQKRGHAHPQTVLGSGKIEEVALTAQTKGANLIVFDRELSPAQIRNLEQLIGVRVSDRTEVILDIFAQRAKSAEGKLQVELAQLEYRLPRLVGRGQALSRLGGGIGTRGPGETKLESDRRVIQKRIVHLQRQVDQLGSQRARMRQKRMEQDLPTIAIVGYTNAGKSTLLNSLTKSDVYAADQLFATLDPTTRRLTLSDPLGRKQNLLLTDTVGFIHELPPPLVDAFRATLEEVTEADALLHVVDASHPEWAAQVKAVQQILQDMPITPPPTLMIFNKIDCIANRATITDQYPEAILISAMQRQGLDTLCAALFKMARYAG